MKRSILLLSSLFACVISASAQMMPDSTVQVIAYWEVGDKYHFQVEDTKYKISGTDTTDIQRSAHLLTLEVVDQTDSTYRVRMSTDDYQHSDYSRAAMTDDVLAQFGNAPVDFETDEYGTFQRVLIDDSDWEGLFAVVDAIVEKVADSQDLDADGRAALGKMMRALFTKDLILGQITQEITPLLDYHGLHLTPGEETEYEQEIPSVFGDDNVIRMNGRFWADKDLTDDYSVVIYDVSESNRDDMVGYVSTFVGNLLKSAGMDSADETRETMASTMADSEILLRLVVFEEIHLDTGWPLDYELTKTVRVKSGEDEAQQVQTRTVTMIFEDEEEESDN